MGGRAFKSLHCPRIPPAEYVQVKEQVMAALRTLFVHVVVPTEIPDKTDYGDVDFLVCGPHYSAGPHTIDSFPWDTSVRCIKALLDTEHGRRGFLTKDCMYFAVRSGEGDHFIQVDVKVCFRPEMFHWVHFELNYASNSKIIGSMIKPLGLTIDPEGLHIRVKEIEESNFPGSMVFVSKDPKDVLRIVRLDRRILNGGFKSQVELYEYLASSWLFHPGHFAERLTKDGYADRLEDRSAAWTYFVKEWLPQRYPKAQDLQEWYKRTRDAVRQQVFTMFPHIATAYYKKLSVWVNEQEEKRLKEMITEAIPSGTDGWKDDFFQPKIFIKHPEPMVIKSQPPVSGDLTPPLTPPLKPTPSSDTSDETDDSEIDMSSLSSRRPLKPQEVPLYLECLPRAPPLTCTPRPPPTGMSPEAKLRCLARWTTFDSETGSPLLTTVPNDSTTETSWVEAVQYGATDDVLVTWAKDMWWLIWVRQSHVNHAGMWKRRFEKEDKKKKKAQEEKEKEREEEKKPSKTDLIVAGDGAVKAEEVC
ncbi:hypothetical protein PTNB73_02184 [Pyrenophora teres f. teres]|uniref:Uncharacterized protein n=1 Tax=Pyrenophora teres f. teres TaxID=97479 RepID=A0A6S6VTJ5_9PLEO|nr:hypothetical protein HRS9139_00769 [Pyrenophora teres f. teres]KAE8853491.1 hypothetical protein HRS9122_00483 [Pyrenophora teres f. teres]KAE8868267.1 hypothetical protein PTNB29_02178 [Pyrenophora teres f. teres]KAE8873033.1 hypothetical protein PTNB73_02184 [Pyrenophora teres f. teres]CAE7023650.1 hypothetical protein PTTW11_03622 [Pyrenophora teres f. teres]